MGASEAKERIQKRQIQIEKLKAPILREEEYITACFAEVQKYRNKSKASIVKLEALINQAKNFLKMKEKEIKEKSFPSQNKTEIGLWKKEKLDMIRNQYDEYRGYHKSLVEPHNGQYQNMFQGFKKRIDEIRNQNKAVAEINAKVNKQCFSQKQMIDKKFSGKKYEDLRLQAEAQKQQTVRQASKISKNASSLNRMSELWQTWRKELIEEKDRLNEFNGIIKNIGQLHKKLHDMSYQDKPKEEVKKMIQKKQTKESQNSNGNEIPESMYCVVCMDKQKNCLNQTCLHLSCCFQCGKSLQKCPICRQVMKPKKVYL